MIIAENLNYFSERLKDSNCRLVAISKTKTVEEIMEAYKAGQRIFGENKVQELMSKYDELPDDIEWHMVGHLQSNKVKYIVPFISMIHSVDSWKLLREINQQAIKKNRVVDCLLQVHIAEEETKFGFSEEELMEVMENDTLKDLRGVRIMGLMGMATFTDQEEQIRKEFRYLKNLFDRIKILPDLPNVLMKELSMGMSDDFEIALEEGSTLIRVGTAVFGERGY